MKHNAMRRRAIEQAEEAARVQAEHHEYATAVPGAACPRCADLRRAEQRDRERGQPPGSWCDVVCWLCGDTGAVPPAAGGGVMRRALVTGASRGIGRAVTELLLGEGWAVWGVSRTDPAIEHPAFWWVEADIAAKAPWNLRFVFGTDPLDALIHCAAMRGQHGPLAESDDAAWVETITTNLLGTYRVVRAALPLLQRSEDARILLFSGGGAFDPSPGYAAYGVSKAGVVALMETLAVELRGSSVSVNCVAPGFVATHIHDGTPDAERRERDGALADVVGCVRHLLAPASRGLSGRTVAAQYDNWADLSPWTVPAVMGTDMGTRTRSPLQQCQRLLKRAR